MRKQPNPNRPTRITYTLFGKPVEKGTILQGLCEKYYGDFMKLEKDLSEETYTPLRCSMLDIREAFWCNEFRTEDLEVRRKVLYENYYSATKESVPI